LPFAATPWETEPPASHATQLSFKRGIDFICSATALLLLLPLMLTIACLIALSMPGGPVLYRSMRIGRGYKPFYMYKFRTMRVDADAQRDRLREDAGLHKQLFKMKHDPRVTPLGRVLRKYSLDELPQFINVLLGDMSLVGPRPLPPDESAWFEPPYTERFWLKPGITGMWQVQGRSDTTFLDLCRLEREYLLQWSLWLDLRLMLATVPRILSSQGAY
jgi:lipopolysaccharide/colanic/teichoic acid biosynthesis glycosyltransferase